MSNRGNRRNPVRVFASLATGCGLSLVVFVALGARPLTDAAAVAGVEQGQGAEVYAQYCSGCHQGEGGGVPGVYPPLAGSEWVTGDADRLVRVLLHGLSGPIMVQGEEYSGLMPAWASVLPDAQMAALATYLRSSFGNAAAPVAPADVARVRAAHAARTTPWTAQELSALATSGAAK